jgi:O-antigen/teichoic acid export membrane protein
MTSPPPQALAHPWGKASWSLIDQGVVSLGNLLINLQLAWLLPIEEYGVFALLLSGMLALQVVSTSLFSYPLPIRLATTEGDDHARLLSLTLVLVGAACLVLDLFLVVGLAVFDRPELIIPACAFFPLWQLQEAARRGLLADLRHRVATVGDSVTYLGQPVLLAAFAGSGSLDLGLALYLMAAACAAGMVIHVSLLRLARPVLRDAGPVILSFWLIGKWQLAINGILLMNVRIYPWALAYSQGAAAAAAFQAMLNVANLMNPLIIGLGNAIPQVAARARAEVGTRRAWLASRAYILVGLLPALAFSGALVVAPKFILSILYGADSPYLETALAVQIVALSGPARYLGDLICCFLIGIEAGRLAVFAYLASLTASLLLVPFTLPFGLAGMAGTIVAASFVLLLSSYWAVTLTGAMATKKLPEVLQSA